MEAHVQVVECINVTPVEVVALTPGDTVKGTRPGGVCGAVE